MPKRHFLKLRAEFMKKDFTQSELSKRIGKSDTYLGYRMRGIIPFSTWDMEVLGKELGIPKEEWLEFFYEGDAV